MKTLITIFGGLAAASIAVPATAATPVTVSLGGPSCSGTPNPCATDGTDGNMRSFSYGGINVHTFTFSYDGPTLSRAFLGQYGSNGLGVTNKTEGNGSDDNSHTVDNYLKNDFVLMIFDTKVNISGAVLNPFSVNGNTDNDAWVSYANLDFTTGPSAYNRYDGTTGVPLGDSVWSTLLNNGQNFNGNMNSPYLTNFATGGNAGNVWIIGAARSDYANWETDSDGNKKNGVNGTDGFKLGSINVTPSGAVPEPATWAMMIAGFGTVGVAMRRRRRIAVTFSTAAA